MSVLPVIQKVFEKWSVIRQKDESQNGCFKKTKHAKFSEKRTFFYPLIRTRTCSNEGTIFMDHFFVQNNNVDFGRVMLHNTARLQNEKKENRQLRMFIDLEH